MKPSYPVDLDDVRAAHRRIRDVALATPVRSYPVLDGWVGGGVRLLVKHENHQPTNAFKVRNGLSALSALSPGQRRRGVVAATRGNHGLGVAFASARLGVAATVVVPHGNNPEKNEAILGYGARLLEHGATYDEAAEASLRLVETEGLTLVHSTNDRQVIAGAGTITLEVLEQAEIDAMVIAVGGGSQAVGALAVLAGADRDVPVYGVQARGAPAHWESWHAGRDVGRRDPDTIADGVATRQVYELTWPALRDGLAGFVAVSDDEILDAMAATIRATHNLVEPAGALGVAGVRHLQDELAGKRVCVILSGANADRATLERCFCRSRG